MLCPTCRTVVTPGHRFCSSCGSPVAVDDLVAVDQPTPPATPVIAATPPQPAMPTLPDMPPVGSMAPPEVTPPPTATAWPITPTGELPIVVATQPFRITLLVFLSVLAGVAAVASSLLEFASYQATGDLLDQFSWRLNDLSSNLMVGTVVGAALMLVGACVGATGRRAGAGLAGGAGLAVAGLLGKAAADGVALLDATKVRFVTSGAAVTLTTTYAIGWVLAVVAAGLGGLVFLASLSSSSNDGRRALDPFVAAAGVLGAAAVVVGPLVPGEGGSWGDNVALDSVPPVAVYLRLLPLALLLLGAVGGFVSRRRWGLGMALGSVSVAVWQTATAFTESGDLPYGLAGGNPGVVDAAHPFRPHVVTVVGLAVVLVAVVVNAIVAVVRRRPSTRGQSPDARRTASAATS